MDGVPNGIDVGNFVGEEFDGIERDCDAENPRMREHLHGTRQMDNAKALQKAESRDRGVEIQTGRESGAEREAEGLQWVHNLHVSSADGP